VCDERGLWPLCCVAAGPAHAPQVPQQHATTPRRAALATHTRHARVFVSGCTAVIVASGANDKADPLGPFNVDYNGNLNLIAAAQAAKVKAFVLVTSIGADDIANPLNLFWGVSVARAAAACERVCTVQAGAPGCCERRLGLRGVLARAALRNQHTGPEHDPHTPPPLNAPNTHTHTHTCTHAHAHTHTHTRTHTHTHARTKQILFWKKRAEEALQRSGLRHTIVRPGGLKSRLAPRERMAGAVVMARPGTYGFPPLQQSGSILRSQVRARASQRVLVRVGACMRACLLVRACVRWREVGADPRRLYEVHRCVCWCVCVSVWGGGGLQALRDCAVLCQRSPCPQPALHHTHTPPCTGGGGVCGGAGGPRRCWQGGGGDC
jgi:uncharacterized protein YbjT (DUF2867 family)